MTGPSSWIEIERRLAIYLRDAFTCAYCGRDLHHCRRGEIGLDHLAPRSLSNGSPDHENSNLVTVCRSCNSRRGNRPWRDYAPGGAQERIERAIARDADVELARTILAGFEPGWETW